MSILTLPQGRIPIGTAMINGQRVDVTIDTEWMRYFITLTERAGGIIGASTTEILVSSFEDAGIPEMQALMFANEQGQNQRPSQDYYIPLDVVDNNAELRARVDAMETEIQALRQGFQL